MSFSKETRIRLVNSTDSNITTTIVSGVDNWDFIGADRARPDRNFHGVPIDSGKSREESALVNAYASNCPFIMTLVFEDGSRDRFRINQKYAIGEAQANFSHFEGRHKFSYDAVDDNVLVITVSNK